MAERQMMCRPRMGLGLDEVRAYRAMWEKAAKHSGWDFDEFLRFAALQDIPVDSGLRRIRADEPMAADNVEWVCRGKVYRPEDGREGQTCDFCETAFEDCPGKDCVVWQYQWSNRWDELRKMVMEYGREES